MNRIDADNKELADQAQTGVAILELALILPVLVFCVFAGLEFARALQKMEIAAALSREAASIAYRNCAADPAGDPSYTEHWNDTAYIVACLTAARDEVLDIGTALTDRVDIIVNLYREDAAHTMVQYSTGAIDPVKHSTKFAVAGGTTVTGGNGAVTLHRRSYVVTGEAYVPFQTIIGFVWKSFRAIPQEFYDATIL